MLGKILAVCLALIACACASSGSAAQSKSPGNNVSHLNYWVTLPQSGVLNVIGVSAPQSTRESEIDIALEDAARKVAMYHGVWVVSRTEQNIGSGFLDYTVDSQVDLEYDQQFEKYMDKLAFNPERDVVSGDGFLFVRFTYPAAFPEKITYSSRKKPDGTPEWTSRPPQNRGNIIFGVGHSGRQMRVRDTVMKSYESAAASLISHISTVIENSEISDSGIYQNKSVTNRVSEGMLHNFTVIETWIDPKTMAVWTLAVAQVQ